MVQKPESIETRLFINGEFVESENKFPLYAPFDESHTCDVHEAREDEVNKAVAAAKAAFPAWEALQATGRKPYLVKLAALIKEHIKEIAELESVCIGSPMSLSQIAVPHASSEFETCAELALHKTGTSLQNTPGTLGVELRQPYGVVGAILPWNVPCAMWAHKCAPALAAGNTVVLKSSEKSPLSALYMAKLAQEAGFPPGVLNILSGFGPTCGSFIVAHPDIRKLSFTGSCATGKLVKQLAAKTNLKNVTLELGGKSPSLVFPDADLDYAAKKLAASVQYLSGQACFANTRVLVHESVAEEFITKYRTAFTANSKALLDYNDPNATGYQPQADKIQYERVMGFIEEGKKENPDNLLTGGNQIGDKGYYISPTIFLNLPSSSSLIQNEIFGMVACINTFKTEAEALAQANNTEYGLFASVFTKDISRAVRISKHLEAGMVAVNTASPDLGMRGMPFGGYKMSGEGRETGAAGLDTYMERKSVFIRFSETEE